MRRPARRAEPRKRNTVYEVMTRRVLGPFVVRVWSKADRFTMGPDPAVLKALTHVGTATETSLILTSLTDALDALSVEAYEITTAYGHGGLCYPDWS